MSSSGEASDAGDLSTTPLSSPLSSQSPASWTHDTSRARYHMRDLASFAQVLEESASRAFPNRGQPARYKKVQVLLLRWADDDLDVWWEVEDLEKVFKDYGFSTEIWLIPSQNSHIKLMLKAASLVDTHESHDTLFIVYYGGHALINSARQSTWSCKRDLRFASLEWSAIQTVFENANSDVLLLLDCCAAASAAPMGGKAITETIAACGWESIAAEPGRFSFTDTLIKVLEDWINRPFTAAMLHSELLSRLKHEKPELVGKQSVERRRTPVYVVTTTNIRACSIQLSKLSPPKTTLPRSSLSPKNERSITSTEKPDMDDISEALQDAVAGIRLNAPQVLISLTLEEDQTLDPNACSEWLSAFPALAKHVKVQGVYQSFSTLLLMSIPVTIWDLLPSNPACSFIGYVSSDNLLGASESSGSVTSTIRVSPSAVAEPKAFQRTDSIEIALNSIPLDNEDLDKMTKLRDPRPSLMPRNTSSNQTPPPLPLLRTDLLREDGPAKLNVRRKSADSGFASASSYGRPESMSLFENQIFISPSEIATPTPRIISPKPAATSSLTSGELDLPTDLIILPEDNMDNFDLLSTLGITTEELQAYISTYWSKFDPIFPVIHRGIYVEGQEVLLDLAMATIGSQYQGTELAYKDGAILSNHCQKRLQLVKKWTLPTMQVVFLLEIFKMFRGPRISTALSQDFEDLQKLVAEDLMSEMMADLILLLVDSVAEVESSQPLTIGDNGSDRGVKFAWHRWIFNQTHHRLASACFVFDVQQAFYHEQPRSLAMMNTTSASFPYLCSENEQWYASSAKEWKIEQSLSRSREGRVTWQSLKKMSPEGIRSLPAFSQMILATAAAFHLAPKDLIGWSTSEIVDSTIPPTLSNMDRLFSGYQPAETLLMFYDTPLIDLLLIMGYTDAHTVPDVRIDEARSRIKTWKCSINAARALQRACRVLSMDLDEISAQSSLWKYTHRTQRATLSHYWPMFVATLVCYSFGLPTLPVSLGAALATANQQAAASSNTPKDYVAYQYAVAECDGPSYGCEPGTMALSWGDVVQVLDNSDENWRAVQILGLDSRERGWVTGTFLRVIDLDEAIRIMKEQKSHEQGFGDGINDTATPHPLTVPTNKYPTKSSGPVQPGSSPPPKLPRQNSNVWTLSDDQTLMMAHALGLEWVPIQETYFQSKTPDACRTRHEILTERQSIDKVNVSKLEETSKDTKGKDKLSKPPLDLCLRRIPRLDAASLLKAEKVKNNYAIRFLVDVVLEYLTGSTHNETFLGSKRAIECLTAIQQDLASSEEVEDNEKGKGKEKEKEEIAGGESTVSNEAIRERKLES